MLLCVYMRATPYARRAVMSRPRIHTSGSRPSVKRAKHQYRTTTKGFGWAGHQKRRSERPHAAARHSGSHKMSRSLREGCHRSVKGCPSLNSYRSGTPRIQVCVSASFRRHCLGTVQAPHHRHRHPARAPMLPALSCSCKPANVRRARCVSCTSCRTATHTLYSRAHMLRARTHSHAAHRATRS